MVDVNLTLCLAQAFEGPAICNGSACAAGSTASDMDSAGLLLAPVSEVYRKWVNIPWRAMYMQHHMQRLCKAAPSA